MSNINCQKRQNQNLRLKEKYDFINFNAYSRKQKENAYLEAFSVTLFSGLSVFAIIALGFVANSIFKVFPDNPWNPVILLAVGVLFGSFFYFRFRKVYVSELMKKTSKKAIEFEDALKSERRRTENAVKDTHHLLMKASNTAQD